MPIAGVANPRLASRMRLFAWFHAALFYMPCFFYQPPSSSQNLLVALLVLLYFCTCGHANCACFFFAFSIFD